MKRKQRILEGKTEKRKKKYKIWKKKTAKILNVNKINRIIAPTKLKLLLFVVHSVNKKNLNIEMCI